ncbi:MAG: molybdopterin molybdotransferase MoeA, partial [Methyloceanibacter sp.]
MALLTVSEAVDRVLRGLEPVEGERVPLAEALGRVLSEDLAARLTQPSFDASAMDGYAVRAADIATLPATLKLIGVSSAGAGFEGVVRLGDAVRIFTGAPVPVGADTVVIQEDTEEAGDRVLVKDGAPGRHIRPRGQDFKEGDVLLGQGTKLGARAVMLAASMNHAELPVRRKPKVALLATGDEVVPPGSQLGPYQIVSSVSSGVAAAVETAGGEALNLGIAKDDRESIVTLAKTGAGADILVTIGGASVGERDLVVEALKSEGLEIDFAKVAMRPGKPIFYGKLGSQRLLGLPGNPVSALVGAHVFL